jgi:uncharacterized protein (TIGR02594 family)
MSLLQNFFDDIVSAFGPKPYTGKPTLLITSPTDSPSFRKKIERANRQITNYYGNQRAGTWATGISFLRSRPDDDNKVSSLIMEYNRKAREYNLILGHLSRDIQSKAYFKGTQMSPAAMGFGTGVNPMGAAGSIENLILEDILLIGKLCKRKLDMNLNESTPLFSEVEMSDIVNAKEKLDRLKSEIDNIQRKVEQERHTGEKSHKTATPWMEVAKGQLGVSEIPGKKNNPQIIEYHSATTLHAKDDETAWCSSFVNWTLKTIGIKGTNSASALSWRKWGQLLKKPAFGSIAILNYGKGKGHVGFVAGINPKGSLVLLGGNQSNKVKYSVFSSAKIVGYVYPEGYIPSYDLPKMDTKDIGSLSSTR